MKYLTLIEKAAYIRGFADGEGHVRALVPNRVKTVELTNTNAELLLLISSYLQDLGIGHYLRNKEKTLKGNRVPCYRLIISQYGNLKRFLEIVGFSDGSKVARLRALVASYKGKKIQKISEKFKVIRYHNFPQ